MALIISVVLHLLKCKAANTLDEHFLVFRFAMDARFANIGTGEIHEGDCG